MLKKTILLAAACALAFTISAGVSFADNGPETMVLKSATTKKTPVTFNHKGHQEMEGSTCADCHHSKNADGTMGPFIAGEAGKCDSCHNKEAMPTPSKKKLNSFEGAAHANCKTCHKAAKKNGNKNAPTSCSACHPKAKK